MLIWLTRLDPQDSPFKRREKQDLGTQEMRTRYASVPTCRRAVTVRFCRRRSRARPRPSLHAHEVDKPLTRLTVSGSHLHLISALNRNITTMKVVVSLRRAPDKDAPQTGLARR